jgi:hypothetical protein
MSTPVINAMIASFCALGLAVGDGPLQRAGEHLRELLADNVLDGTTEEILESVLVAIDHDATAGGSQFRGILPTMGLMQ